MSDSPPHDIARAEAGLPSSISLVAPGDTAIAVFLPRMIEVAVRLRKLLNETYSVDVYLVDVPGYVALMMSPGEYSYESCRQFVRGYIHGVNSYEGPADGPVEAIF